jgi:hypothetical protein
VGKQDRRRLAVRAALAAALVVVAVVVLAQLLLPGIVAGRVRSKLARYGRVQSVSVSAWPAVKLLWGHADEVEVRASWLNLTPVQSGALVAEATSTTKVRATVQRAQEGSLKLSDVRFYKNGSKLHGQATTNEADVKAALPPGFDVSLVESSGGTVVVRASGGLFGLTASIEAVAEAQEGKLVAHPRLLFLEGLTLTLFESSKVYVEGVEARDVKGAPGAGNDYVLTMWASLK